MIDLLPVAGILAVCVLLLPAAGWWLAKRLPADSLVRLTAASFAVNGKKWTNVFPSDGLFDSKEETFRFKTEALKPGTYVLVLKVKDAAGNTGSGDVVFTVPAAGPFWIISVVALTGMTPSSLVDTVAGGRVSVDEDVPVVRSTVEARVPEPRFTVVLSFLMNVVPVSA